MTPNQFELRVMYLMDKYEDVFIKLYEYDKNKEERVIDNECNDRDTSQ